MKAEAEAARSEFVAESLEQMSCQLIYTHARVYALGVDLGGVVMGSAYWAFA